MKEHILFIVENGTIPYDIRIVNEAKALKAKGYDVSVICPIEKNATLKFEKFKGIDVYRHFIPKDTGRKFAIFIEYIVAIYFEFYLSCKIFLKKPFHIIHAANPPDNIFLIALFFKLFKVKFVFDHHDLSPEVYVTKFGNNRIIKSLLLLLEKFSFKFSDIVICTNESYKKIAIDRGKKESNKIFIVRNGPDIDVVDNIFEIDNIKESNEFLVGYIGIIGTQERIDVLLKIIEYIVHKKKINNIKFLIIGDGPAKSIMEKLAINLNISEYVKFVGFINYPIYFNYLASVDVCVNPEYRDAYTDKSTMIKIMEYMICKKAIVQFETNEGRQSAGDAAIYIKDNDIIEFAEQLIEILNNENERIKLGKIGYNRVVDKLSWNNQVQILLNAYNSIK